MANRALVPTRAALDRIASGELPQYCTKAEVDRAIALEPRADVKLFLRLLFVTGVRVSEALAVEGRQVDGNTGTLRVRTLKQRRVAPERVLPLPGDVATGLALLRRGAKERLFQWTRQWAHQVVRAALQRASIEGERSHPRSLRHSFAVHCLQQGVTLNALQQLMGHRFLSSTAIYLRLTGMDVARQYHAVQW